MPGTEAGKLKIPAGTTQETSPLSLDEVACVRPPSGIGAVRRPVTGLPADFWKSRANCCSCSVHLGMPTASMFFWIASANALLASCGQADAEYFTPLVAPVISTAHQAAMTRRA